MTPANDFAAKARSLWAQLNSDPTAARAKRTSPHWLVLQWQMEGVVVAEGDVSGHPSLRHAFEFAWPAGASPEDSPLQAGLRLKEQLSQRAISGTQTAVVVPREMAVVRRLELPNVPDDELPELVRFQAAARASAPLERLALDYVPVPSATEGQRAVLLVTIDAVKLRAIHATVEAAGLDLAKVTFSPLATAELVQRAAPDGARGAAVVVWQIDNIVELSLMDAGQLVFSHSIELPASEESHVKPLQAELTRAIVAMSQQHPARGSSGRSCCLVRIPTLQCGRSWPNGSVPACPSSIRPRSWMHHACRRPTNACCPAPGRPSVSSSRSGTPHCPRSIFSTRGRNTSPPTAGKSEPGSAWRPRRWLEFCFCGGPCRPLAREEQISALDSEIALLEGEVSKGKDALEDSAAIDRWRSSAPAPMPTLRRFYGYLPSTKDMIVTDLRVDPPRVQSGATAAITATLHARSDDVIREFQDRLRAGGYKELDPKVIGDGKSEPDYPRQYELVVHEFPAAPAATASPQNKPAT